jgi:hypothetical protein
VQIQACTAKLSSSVHTVIAYQPPDRFWPFQLAETGIFLAAALPARLRGPTPERVAAGDG